MSDREKISGVFISIRTQLAKVVSTIVPPKDVEDIVQEAYIRVCQVKSDNTIHQPRSFLLKTARNLALDYAKRSETRFTHSAENDELNLSEEERWQDEVYESVASNEEFANFCEAVRQLPAQCRRAFVLKKVYGYTQREISLALDLRESTVEKHIAKGMKRCTYFMLAKQGVNDFVSDSRKSDSVKICCR